MIRLFLFEANALIRHSLTVHLNAQHDMTVIGDTASGARGLPLLEQLHPDIVTMAWRLDDMDGSSLTRTICRCFPNLPVIFYSLYDDSAYIERAYVSGAAGYVLKSAPLAELYQTILQVWQSHHSSTSQPDPTSP